MSLFGPRTAISGRSDWNSSDSGLKLPSSIEVHEDLPLSLALLKNPVCQNDENLVMSLLNCTASA